MKRTSEAAWSGDLKGGKGRVKLGSGAFPDVRRWRFDDYTSHSADWFRPDGVHETSLGSWGVTDWVSRHVRAFGHVRDGSGQRSGRGRLGA